MFEEFLGFMNGVMPMGFVDIGQNVRAAVEEQKILPSTVLAGFEQLLTGDKVKAVVKKFIKEKRKLKVNGHKRPKKS